MDSHPAPHGPARPCGVPLDRPRRATRGPRVPPAAVRVLVVLMGMVLVAALQMTVPAHGDPGPPGAAEGGSPGERASVQGRWDWPVPPPHRILAPFVAPEHRYGAGHRGVDIAAGSGAEVRAVEDGTVRFAGPVAGRGVVSILHADGLLSTYEPVSARVAAGDRVRAGEVIGELEDTGDGAGAGHCAQACLHLGARRGGADYIDPEPLLRGAGPSVLLPLEGVGAALDLLEGRAG